MDDILIAGELAQDCGGRYPQAFLEAYEPFECFAHAEEGETLLVKSRQSGQFFVAKCYAKGTAAFPTPEPQILKKLQHAGLPRFVGEYTNDGMLCVVREYVDGTPLDRYLAQNGSGEAAAVRFAVALCDILVYLHGQKPPVIHRDIKPQNLIVDHQGRLWLIDFGISRLYDPNAAEDTVCCGTRHFAAPEQYGFAQTSVRSDLFSLGILLGWLLTGEVKREAILHSIPNRRLKRIVEKCTSFAPEDRYASAARVRADLEALDGRRKKLAARRLCTALACLCCLGAGFMAGLHAKQGGIFAADNGVSFAEPLVEQAVRLMLDIEEGAPVSKKDLLSITELYIYGDQAAKDYAGYDALSRQMAFKDGVLKNGGMASLLDVEKLPNLQTLCVALEDITDLSPLRGLQALKVIDLRHNPVADLSPLRSLPHLTEVCLFGTRVSDLSPLRGCPLLNRIEAGGTFVTSVSTAQEVQSLKNLGLMKAPIQTLRGLEVLAGLEQISLSEVADGDLTPLLSLPRLKSVTLDEALRQDAQECLAQAMFSIGYQ